MSENHFLTASTGRIMIAAHRGTWGGNIVQNTIQAFENGIKHGADIIEVDVAKSTDGIFYVFHTGQEQGVLGTDKRLDEMTSEEVMMLGLINSMQETTRQQVNRLEDVLAALKGRAYINIDRSWFYLEDTLDFLADKGMDEQILLKCPPRDDLLELLEGKGNNMMYMPIIHKMEELTAAFSRKLNIKAVELVFKDESEPHVSRQVIDRLHQDGIAVWVNAITLDDETLLAAGHDDNLSILEDMESGWGWLADRGFDIIQTDWPMLLKEFLNNRRKDL